MEEQAWWVYVLIAFGCALLFLFSKVVEKKYMEKEEDSMWLVYTVLGVVGFLSALKAAEILKIL